MPRSDLDFALMCIHERHAEMARGQLCWSLTPTLSESDSMPGTRTRFFVRTRWLVAKTVSCKGPSQVTRPRGQNSGCVTESLSWWMDSFHNQCCFSFNRRLYGRNRAKKSDSYSRNNQLFFVYFCDRLKKCLYNSYNTFIINYIGTSLGPNGGIIKRFNLAFCPYSIRW